MLKKLLRPLYIPLFSFFNKLRYYIWPNLLTNTKVYSETIPQFQQKTFITGKGSVYIGKNCAFGYKPGGFHYGGSIELQARTPESQIKIGSNVTTNNNIFICSSGSIEIGDYTLIGQNVCIMDFEAHGI